MTDNQQEQSKADFSSHLRELINKLPQPDHMMRVSAFILAVYEASGLNKEEFTHVVRTTLSLLHNERVELSVPGERLCPQCNRPGIMRSASNGDMVCVDCHGMDQETQLARWRMKERGLLSEDDN